MVLGQDWTAHHQEPVVEVQPLGARKILGSNSTENDEVTRDALVTENTNTAVGFETSKGLGYLWQRHQHASVFVCVTGLT